ncbi:Hypothetical predicted protein, partial [Pelobates cultripes]
IGIQGDSDHSPVSIQIKSPLFKPKERHWQLNKTILSDAECSTLTTQVLTQYFKTNTTPEVSPLITWETHKCVVRGHYINLCTQRKRENTRHILDLTKQITELETTHKRELTEEVYLHLINTRRQLRDILSQKLLKVVRRSNRYFYEYSNKCGRLLARTLQQRWRQNHIHKIKAQGRKETRLPAEIMQAFRVYYTSLYNLADTPSALTPTQHRRELTDFLTKHVARKLTPDQSMDMEQPLSLKELSAALKLTKSNKAPGTDGLPASYHRTYRDLLLPHLLTGLNSLLEGGQLSVDTL